jgi:hypothetical protein
MFTRFVFTFAGKRYFEDHLTHSIIAFNNWYNRFVAWGYTDIVYSTIDKPIIIK